MNISRRGFLVSLSAAVAALTVKTLVPSADLDPVAILEGVYEPKALLWTPDDRNERILPARIARISDRALMNLTRDVLRLVEEQLGPRFRAIAVPRYGGQPLRLGETVQVREPMEFTVMDPANWDSFEPITSNLRAVCLDQHRMVECAMTSIHSWAERRENYPDFRQQHLRAIAHILARDIRKHRLNVFGELALPMTGESASAVSGRSGIALRGLQFYDHHQAHDILRFDVLGAHADGLVLPR